MKLEKQKELLKSDFLKSIKLKLEKTQKNLDRAEYEGFRTALQSQIRKFAKVVIDTVGDAGDHKRLSDMQMKTLREASSRLNQAVNELNGIRNYTKNNDRDLTN